MTHQEMLQRILLGRCRTVDEYMSDILSWYIDVGIVLEENDKTGYMIKPIIGENHWSSKQEWQKEKQWLLPYYKHVLTHLRNIRMEEENVRKQKN